MREVSTPSRRPPQFWLGFIAFALVPVTFVQDSPDWIKAMLVGLGFLLLGWTQIHHPESFFSGLKVRNAWPYPGKGKAWTDPARLREDMRRNGYLAVALGVLCLGGTLVLFVRAR